MQTAIACVLGYCWLSSYDLVQTSLQIGRCIRRLVDDNVEK